MSRRRTKNCELISDLELACAEAIDRRGPAAVRPGGALRAGVLEQLAAQEDALEVRRRHLVPERGGVEIPQLRDRERRRREREAEVRVRELRPEPLAAGEHDLLV